MRLTLTLHALELLLGVVLLISLLPSCGSPDPIPEEHVCAIGVFLHAEDPCLVTQRGYTWTETSEYIHCFSSREEAQKTCKKMRSESCWASSVE